MTKNQEQNTFSNFLKELTLPISTFIGIVIFMLEFRDKIDKFSIKIISILLPLFFLIWLIFVWRKKIVSDNNKKIYSYNKIIRIGAILAFILSLIPSYFVINSSLPVTINFQIENKTENTLKINYLNNYNILTQGTNGIEFTVTSGILNVKGKGKDNLTIMPNTICYFNGKFENQSKIKYYLTGDYWLTLDVRTNGNQRIRCDKMYHLTKKSLKELNLFLYYE